MKIKKHYVGLDVHKDTVTVAVAEGGRGGEVRVYGTISSDLRTVETVLRRIRALVGRLGSALVQRPKEVLGIDSSLTQ